MTIKYEKDDAVPPLVGNPFKLYVSEAIIIPQVLTLLPTGVHLDADMQFRCVKSLVPGIAVLDIISHEGQLWVSCMTCGRGPVLRHLRRGEAIVLAEAVESIPAATFRFVEYKDGKRQSMFGNPSKTDIQGVENETTVRSDYVQQAQVGETHNTGEQ